MSLYVKLSPVYQKNILWFLLRMVQIVHLLFLLLFLNFSKHVFAGLSKYLPLVVPTIEKVITPNRVVN